MAVPTIVAIGFSSTTSVTKPAGGTTGDFYVIYASHESTAGDHTCTGFTSSGTGGLDDSYSTWLWKLYDGSEGASFTISGPSAAILLTAFIVRGADTAGTVLTNVPQGATSSSADHVLTGLTTTIADTLVLVGWTNFSGYGSPTSDPAGYTIDDVQAGNSRYLWHKTLAVAGATGTVAVSRAQGATLSSGGLLGFAPTAGGAPPFVAPPAPSLWRRGLGLR